MNRLILIGLLVALTGCSALWPFQPGSRSGVSSSLVDYLYPKGEVPPDFDAQVPHLDLPLRVGLAFVPTTVGATPGLSEATKSELLERVRLAFEGREYIQHIEVIPDTYLRSSKGFDGMQQVARLYGVDVMALVSYDQVAATDDTRASLLYWTIVGAYFIKGTENEVQTFVDTAVFDVSSRKLLFRAPGIDKRESRSTLVESTENLRKSRELGFAGAMATMTTNLTSELDNFEKKLEDNPTLAQVAWQDGRGGGGAINLFWLVLIAVRLTSAARDRFVASLLIGK